MCITLLVQVYGLYIWIKAISGVNKAFLETLYITLRRTILETNSFLADIKIKKGTSISFGLNLDSE